MKKSFKTITAAALSAAMIFVPAISSFADEPAVPTSNAATGNILAYSLESVIVPTNLKLALNPDGYDVTKKFVPVAEGATFVSDETYYTLESGKYKKQDITAFASNTVYYTADITDDQIVSFNYGIVNKSTAAKKISVSFAISGTASTGTEIEFVDAEAKAEAKSEQNTSGAEEGELKMFLQVVPAKEAENAALTVDSYAKATSFGASTIYYTKADNTYSLAGTDGKFGDETAYKTAAAAAQLYVKSTTVGTEITGAELADVGMTVADNAAAKIAFDAGKNSSKAKIAFKLDEAEYDLKDGAYIDFSTQQSDLENLVELKNVGEFTAFTFTGKMNENADWTKANVKALTLTPTYKVEKVSGDEEAIAQGLNQIVAAADTYTVTYVANDGANPATANKTETVNVGTKATGKVDGEDITFEREGYTFAGWYDKASGDDAVEVTITDIDAATTVYAHWTLADKAPSIATTAYTLTADTPVEVTVDLGAGDKKATSVSAVMFGSANTLSNGYATYENGVITFTTNCVNNLLGRSNASFELVVKFNDTDNTEVTITLSK